jgi:hypothetical protein
VASATPELRLFLVEAYYAGVRPELLSELTGLPAKYIYGVLYKEGLREVRDLKMRDQALELAEELGVELPGAEGESS